MANLRSAMLKRDISLYPATPAAKSLQEGGGVAGLSAGSGVGAIRIRARHGLSLAAEGFDQNTAMQQQFDQLPGGEVYSSVAEGNTGDAINMALGAAL